MINKSLSIKQLDEGEKKLRSSLQLKNRIIFKNRNLEPRELNKNFFISQLYDYHIPLYLFQYDAFSSSK